MKLKKLYTKFGQQYNNNNNLKKEEHQLLFSKERIFLQLQNVDLGTI